MLRRAGVYLTALLTQLFSLILINTAFSPQREVGRNDSPSQKVIHLLSVTEVSLGSPGSRKTHLLPCTTGFQSSLANSTIVLSSFGGCVCTVTDNNGDGGNNSSFISVHVLNSLPSQLWREPAFCCYKTSEYRQLAISWGRKGAGGLASPEHLLVLQQVLHVLLLDLDNESVLVRAMLSTLQTMKPIQRGKIATCSGPCHS